MLTMITMIMMMVVVVITMIMMMVVVVITMIMMMMVVVMKYTSQRRVCFSFMVQYVILVLSYFLTSLGPMHHFWNLQSINASHRQER